MKIFNENFTEQFEHIPKGGYTTWGKYCDETVLVFHEFTEKDKERIYGTEVEKLLRKKYSLSEELAILRQRDTKPEEFAEYYAYVEECKIKIKGV